MRQIFAKLAMGGLIALASAGSLAVPAFADSVSFGLRSGSVVDVQYREEHRRYRDERDWGRPDRRPGWDRPRGGCSPRFAAGKASEMGLRRVRVVDVSPRRVVVEGRRRGDFRTVVFANVRGCPVIR